MRGLLTAGVSPVEKQTGFSSCGSQAPEHRLNSCRVQAQLLRSRRDPPGSGIDSGSPASAGGLPTMEPSGKPDLGLCFPDLLHSV